MFYNIVDYYTSEKPFLFKTILSINELFNTLPWNELHVLTSL